MTPYIIGQDPETHEVIIGDTRTNGFFLRGPASELTSIRMLVQAANKHVKHVVIAHESTDGIQALYIDNVLVAYDDTICVSTILEHITTGEPMTLRQLSVDLPEGAEWPVTLDELIQIDKERNV